MIVAFNCILGLFVVLFGLKVILTLMYWSKEQDVRLLMPHEEKNLSVVQAILSGDPSLEQNLIENLNNLRYASFIWLVDKKDNEAQRITKNILTTHAHWVQRVKIVDIGDIPKELNPKVFKLNQSMPFLNKYTVVLDDDTVMSLQNLKRSYDALEREDVLITGIPFYRGTGGLFSSLVTGFVNANSLFTYLPMALLSPPRTINGMFYMTSSQVLKKLDGFKSIEDKLCDDYEMAKLYRRHQMPSIQTIMTCKVITTITDGKHYLRLMKRWMVFANFFIKENLSLHLVCLVVLPSFLPSILLIMAIALGWNFLGLFLLIHLLKSFVFFLVRKNLLRSHESLVAILYEVIADYLQVFHYIHALCSPQTIHWRNRRVRINENQVHFES